jgi:single-strand DNA-binding protein
VSLLHRIEAIGGVVRSPELRYLPSGTPILNVDVAVDETYEQNGEKRGKTYYWTLAFFGEQAERVNNRNYQKGDRLWFEGIPDLDIYTSRDGNPRMRTQVRLPRCIKLSGRNGNGDFHAAEATEPGLESEASAPLPPVETPAVSAEEDVDF